jgi:uncharacterized protein (DUF1330 family)
MNIYITQLIYIRAGEEKAFDQFESIAIPAISKYNGKLLLRIRPDKEAIIESSMEAPYEIHLCVFDTGDDFKNFMQDEERKQFLHLKEQSVRSVIMIKGKQL